MLSSACDAEGTHLSNKELIDHVFGFLLAGFDVDIYLISHFLYTFFLVYYKILNDFPL